MKTICLTLPEKPDRMNSAKERLALHGIHPHFVYGISGEKSGVATTHTYEYDNPGSGYIIGSVTVGIFLGHYIAWSVCAALPDDMFLILEDDVIPCENFISKMEFAVSCAKGFDMLFLGSCCTQGQEKKRIMGDVFEVRYPQCLHAYVVTKKAVQILLKDYRDIHGPIDCVLLKNGYSNMKVMAVIPSIANQENTELSP